LGDAVVCCANSLLLVEIFMCHHLFAG